MWPNGCMDQYATWYGGRPRRKQHCVRQGPCSPSPTKGAEAPNYRPMSVVTKRIHGSRCHLVWRQASAQATLCKMATHHPLPQKGAQPPLHRISAHVCSGQTAGWIKMALGTKVGRGPGHIVTWGRSYPRKGRSPQFSAHVYCGQTVAHLNYC